MNSKPKFLANSFAWRGRRAGVCHGYAAAQAADKLKIGFVSTLSGSPSAALPCGISDGLRSR